MPRPEKTPEEIRAKKDAENARKRAAYNEDARAKKRAYHVQHRERYRQQMRENYQKNREQRLTDVKAYAAEHKEEKHAYNLAYSEKHREKLRADARAWNAANGERHRATSLVYYYAHKKEVREKKYAHYQAHKAEIDEKKRIYNLAHPEVKKTSSNNRRAAEANVPVRDLTAAQWAEIQAACNHRCVYCGKRAKGRLTMDHITPLSHGGAHTASNIVPACKPCNSHKHTGGVPSPVQPLLLTVAPSKKLRNKNI